MQGAEENVYKLISNLTETERSHFRQFTARSAFGQSSRKFFDLLVSMPQFDDAVARSYCANQLKVDNYNQFKRELFDLVLNSLEGNRTHKSDQEDVDRQIREIDILLDKKLRDLARKRIHKVKKQAERIAYHNARIELMNREIRLLLSTSPRQTVKKVVELHEELELYLEDFLNNKRYHKLYDQMLNLTRTTFDGAIVPENLERIERLMQDPLLQPNSTFPDNDSELLYHNIHAKFARITGKAETERKHRKAILDQWLENPFMAEAQPSGYIKALAMYASLYRRLPTYNQPFFRSLLSRIESARVRTFREKTEQFQALAMLTLYDGLNSPHKQFTEMLKDYIPKLLKNIDAHRANMPDSRFLTLYFNIAAVYFLHGDFEQALELTTPILNCETTEHRQDIQMFTPIFSYILLFELHGIDTSDSLLLRSERAIRKKQLNMPFERICIKYCKKLKNVLPQETRHLIYSPWHDELKELQHRAKNHEILGIDEILCWLDSKISGSHIYEIHRKHVDNNLGGQ